MTDKSSIPAPSSKPQLQLYKLWKAACLALVICGFFLSSSISYARTKHAELVMDSATGKILYSRSANVRVYPASLTKMMTLYLLFEDLEAKRINMRTPLKISAHAARQPSSKLGLIRGKTIPVHTAIEALVIKSANDVAVTVAENLARSEVKFAKRMTRKARQLGMSRTTFRNASGLYHSQQMTTAHDLAILGQALQRDFPQYYKYFALKSFKYKGKTIRTHNNLLKSFSGADGMKTGYISASGFNIVTSAKRNGKRIIAVVIGGNTSKWRDQQTARIMNNAFQNIAFAANKVQRPPLNPENKRLLAANAHDINDDVQIAQVDTVNDILGGEGDVDNDPSDTAQPAPLKLAFNHISPNTRTKTKTNKTWSVQVGAFSDRKAAISAANHALTIQTHKSAEHAKRSIKSIRTSSRTLYRARITHLSSQDASRTCKLMRRDNHPCMTIKAR